MLWGDYTVGGASASGRRSGCTAKSIKLLIEAYYPVEIDVSLTGWGKFLVSARPLVPVYRVYWGGRFWYLSAEEASSGSPRSRRTGSSTAAALTSARCSPGGPTARRPIDMANSEGNVFHSSLPLALISRWYAQDQRAKLAPYVKYVQAGVKEGTPVVRLIPLPPRHEGERRAGCCSPTRRERWAEAVLAVRKLYGALENMPPDIFIDCTYK